MTIREDYLNQALLLHQKAVDQHTMEADHLWQAILAGNPRLRQIEERLAAIGASLPVLTLAGRLDELEPLQRESARLSQEKAELIKAVGYTPIGPMCPLCGDTGYVSGKPCRCITALMTELALEDFYRTCPAKESRFDNFSLDYYPEQAKKRMSSILSFCKTYADTLSADSANLLFMGKSGLGKTHLTLAIAEAGIKKGLWVVYGPAQNLFAAAEKEHFSFGGHTEETDRLLACDLLILDDLGTEFNSAFSQSLFYNLVNTRLLQHRPTVINTNLDFDELEQRYTARITSRFTGDYVLKEFLGNDIRQLKAMERLNKG